MTPVSVLHEWLHACATHVRKSCIATATAAAPNQLWVRAWAVGLFSTLVWAAEQRTQPTKEVPQQRHEGVSNYSDTWHKCCQYMKVYRSVSIMLLFKNTFEAIIKKNWKQNKDNSQSKKKAIHLVFYMQIISAYMLCFTTSCTWGIMSMLKV